MTNEPTRFLRPIAADTYDVVVDGEVRGIVYRNPRASGLGQGGWMYTANGGDTHLFGFASPEDAARDMVDVQAAGGAAAVQIANERAHGWSTD